MRRVVQLVVLLTALIGGTLIPSALAQEDSPVASVGIIDLAAMVLLPDDIAEPGFGTGNGFAQDVEEVAESIASVTGLPESDIANELQRIGFGRSYGLNLEQRVAEGAETPTGIPDPIGKRIVTMVTEYASAASAAEGFDYLEREIEAKTGDQDLPVATIGDEAVLTHYSRVSPTSNVPFQELNLTFRTGNYVGNVYIQDFSNQMPETAEAEALAEQLKDRIEQVLAGGAPGLSYQIIRPEGTAEFEGYRSLNGEPIPAYLESAEVIALLRDAYGEATAVYILQQPLSGGPYLVVWLYQFPSAESAATWLEDDPTAVMDESISGYVDVEEIADAEGAGEESRVYSFGFPLDEETTSRGYAVFSRVGPVIARVQVDSVPEAPLAAVQELAEAQVRCFEAESCLDPVPIPEGLEMPTTESAAKPAA